LPSFSPLIPEAVIDQDYIIEKKVIFVDKRKLFTINREKREIFVWIRTFSPKSTNSSCHGFFTNVHY
jgi:hypothetical protein